MKKSEFKAYLREEIISVLSEADPEDIKAQQDLNKELDLTLQKAEELGQSLSEEDEELMKENLNEEDEEFYQVSADFSDIDGFVENLMKVLPSLGINVIDDPILDGSDQVGIILSKREIDPKEVEKYYGFNDNKEDEDDNNQLSEVIDAEPTDAEIKKRDSVSKIANKLGETTNEMKKLAKKYKDTKEPEKTRLLTRLKELTKIKKELEGLL